MRQVAAKHRTSRGFGRPTGLVALLATITAAVALTAAATAWAQKPSLKQAVAQLRAGNAAAAEQICARILKRQPDNLPVRFWYARALLAQGRAEEAAENWRMVIKRKPKSIDSRYWLGVALMELGDTAGARKQFEAVLKLNPKHREAKRALEKLAAAPGPAPSVEAEPPLPEPPHHRAWLDLSKAGIDPGAVEILSRNVLDYTFSSAPTDWYVASGLWGTTNRWTCSPQWSWFGGMAELGPAAVWCKHVFEGDIVVDMYCSWGMLYGYPRSYKNPSDLNITICGDGANLFSGYTFIYGGWKNNRSAILKNGRVIAENEDIIAPVFEDGYPSTYQFHRKWWNIRARKIGNVLQFFVDGELACEAVDPQPLRAGRVALWTYDNRMIIARTRIYYERIAQAGEPLPLARWTVPIVTQAADALPPMPQVPGVLYSDFELTTSPLAPRPDGFAKITLAAPGAGGSGRCVKIINTGPGGTFGVNLIAGPVDLAKTPVLSFDYAVGPEVKVNLYCTVGGRLYELIFTGPPEGAPLATVIGQIPDVATDGQWHRAVVDLATLIREASGAWSADSLVASELWFGNLSERDYLLAGNGGNPAGASWCLDNAVLYTPAAKFTISPPTAPKGKKIQAVACTVDDSPVSEPDHTKTVDLSAGMAVNAEKSGWRFAHVAVQLDDGTWLPPAHVPLPLDAEPPAAELVQPKPGTAAGDVPIVIALRDAEPGAINWRAVKVKIAGAELTAASPGVTVRPLAGELVVDPAAAGLTFDDGQKVTVELAEAADLAGHKASGSTSWTFTYQRNEDRRPPEVLAVEPGRPYLVDADFEHGMPKMEPYSGSGGARLSIDRSTAASGSASLRLTNPRESGHFGIRFVTEPFDAGLYRIVSFDYRIPPHYRGDFAVYVNGDWKAIKFTDTDNPLGYIGKVEGVKADGRWHHAEFNLYEMLVRDDPTAASYIARWFVLADWGSALYNFRRRQIWLDNFQVIPVVSGLEPLKIKVSARDTSGIAGVSWLIDQISTAALPNELKAKSAEFEVKPPGDGVWWLHLKVADAAGNFSRPVSRRLYVDAQRPMASIIAPAPKSAAAQSTISLALLDRGFAGIDPASIILEIDGKQYKCSNAGLTFDARKQRLTWNCEQVQPKPVVFPDGHEVKVRLVQARDYAGNEVEQHPSWTWKMDYRLDHKAPLIAVVDSPTHKTFRTDTFEQGLGQWRRRGSQGAKVELDTSTSASGRACVKLTQVKKGGTMSAYVCTSTFYAEAYPIIAFDYNFQPGVKLDLMLRCNGTWFAIAMTDNPAGAIGRVPRMVADGKWHHASVDIFPLLRRQIRRGSLAVTQIIVTDRNSMDNPVGAVARFDNFIIGRIGKGPVKLAWRATDATGIKGYSYAIDRNGGTVPDTTPETTEQTLTLSDLAPGVWFFHIRAQDGAGNWGPVRHYAILNRSAG